MTRKLTRRVAVGGIPIGGGEPVVVQSMLNTRAGDVKASVAQPRRWSKPAARSSASLSQTRMGCG